MQISLQERDKFKVSGEVEMELLGPDQIMNFWPFVKEELEKVPHIWKSWWTLDYLLERALNGNIQMWGMGTGGTIYLVLFTQICRYPAGNILQLFLMFGSGLKVALPQIAASLEFFARQNDVISVEVHGRPGWARLLREYGFVQERVLMSRKIEKVRVH